MQVDLNWQTGNLSYSGPGSTTWWLCGLKPLPIRTSSSTSPKWSRGWEVLSSYSFSSSSLRPIPPYEIGNSPVQTAGEEQDRRPAAPTARTGDFSDVEHSSLGTVHQNVRCHFHNKAFFKATTWPMGISSKRQLFFVFLLSSCILINYLIYLSPLTDYGLLESMDHRYCYFSLPHRGPGSMSFSLQKNEWMNKWVNEKY